MSDSYPDSTQMRAQLGETYHQLPPVERQMVQLFSVIYEPVNRTSFLACLNQAEIKDEYQKP